MKINKMKEKIAKISIVVNFVLVGTKIFAGFVSNSSSILAEGIHSLMDIFSSTISYVGIKIAKNQNRKHPYGHFKFEVLSGIAITLILFATGIAIIYEAYEKFLHPIAILI